MSSVLITAATSKAPFLILGGLLAVWAAVLAGYGLKRPGWPNARGQRAVLLATLVLAGLAVAASIATG